MADWSGLQIGNTNIFSEWRDRYNQIPTWMTATDTSIANLSTTVTNNANTAYQNAIIMAIALG